MCGIAGYLELDGGRGRHRAAPDEPRDRASRARRRGPVRATGPVGLGHRRLAIIDLAAGAQPMLSADGRLRHHLQRRGLQLPRAARRARGARRPLPLAHRHRGRAQALTPHGAPACVERFNGMFAFAIWDRSERELFLARDRYGIKPLYYAEVGPTRSVRVGDQGAARASGARRGAGPRRTCSSTSPSRTSSPTRTLFDGVRLLPPGTHHARSRHGRASARRSATGTSISASRTTASRRASTSRSSTGCSARPSRASSSRDVPSALLRGGMDSGSITALAARRAAAPQHLHRRLRPATPPRASSWPSTSARRPSACPTCSRPSTTRWCSRRATWSGSCRARLASRGPRVGQCYPNYYAGAARQQVRQGRAHRRRRRRAVRRLPVALLPRGRQRRLRATTSTSTTRSGSGSCPTSMLRAFCAPVWRRGRARLDRATSSASVFPQHADALDASEDYVNHSLYFEARTFLHGLLVVEDKLSMAHGLENRVPFLDNDLVDFAMRVPVRLQAPRTSPRSCGSTRTSPGRKTERYFERTRDGKLLLRQADGALRAGRGHQRRPSRASRRPTRAGSGATASTTCAPPAAAERAHLRVPRPRGRPGRWSSEHLDGAPNRRLLIWSLLVSGGIPGLLHVG